MALATVEEFAARHELDDADEELVEALLADASAVVLAEVAGSSAEWVTRAGEDEPPRPPKVVVSVTIEVAYRAFSNPDALAQARVADIAHSWRAEIADALYLTKEEKRRLRRAAGRSSFRSMTMVTPYSGPIAVPIMDHEDPDAGQET